MRTTTLDAVTLEKLISAAVAAPSIHNTQPWRYRLDPDTATVQVRAATERALWRTDPVARALHVSVGAAVFNLRVAVAHFGWEPVVRLLPDPAEPGLLATVRLAGSPSGGARHREDLYDVLWRRHTNRRPFADTPLPPELLDELSDTARSEGALLSVRRPGETARLLEVTAEAERRNTGDPARRTESRRWIRESGGAGLPGWALGPQDAGGRLPVRDFAALRPSDHLPPAAFEPHPVIAVLSTAQDRPADWLRAGQALEHALLVATAHGVRASLLHQAMEWADLRWVLRDPRGPVEHVQMLIRFGYGPEGRATPRRGARDTLDGADRWDGLDAVGVPGDG